MSVWLSVVTLKHPKADEQEAFQQKMQAYEDKVLASDNKKDMRVSVYLQVTHLIL